MNAPEPTPGALPQLPKLDRAPPAKPAKPAKPVKPAKPRREKPPTPWGAVFGGLVGLAVAFWIATPKAPSSPPPPPAQIEFASDGSNRAVIAAVKERLYRPHTFRHESTRSWEMGSHWVVKMEFTAETDIGVRQSCLAEAKVTNQGRVYHLDILVY